MIENINKRWFIEDDPFIFQPLQFSVEGGTGHIHNHRPFGDGLWYSYPVVSGLPRLHQQPKSRLLRNAIIRQQLQPLLQHIGGGGNFRRVVLQNADILLHERQKVLPAKHHYSDRLQRGSILPARGQRR